MSDEGEIGLAMWRRTMPYSTNQQVCVHVMRYDKACEWPCGVSSTWYAHEKKPLFDGLEMSVWVSDVGTNDNGTPWTHTWMPSYRDVHEVTLAKAKAMVSMLAKIETAMQKDDAHEHGEIIQVFARVVGAKFIAVPKAGGDHPYQLNPRSSNGWCATRWVWHTDVIRAKSIFRTIVQDCVDSEMVRRGTKSAA